MPLLTSNTYTGVAGRIADKYWFDRIQTGLTIKNNDTVNKITVYVADDEKTLAPQETFVFDEEFEYFHVKTKRGTASFTATASGSLTTQKADFANNKEELDNSTNWYHNSTGRRMSDSASAFMNSLAIKEKLAKNTLSLFVAGDKITHDATLVTDITVDTAKRAYVVTSANQTTNVDAPAAPSNGCFTRLYVVDITVEGSYSVLNTYVVAENDQTYNGVKMTSATGVPNAYLVGNILHILFTARVNNEGTWSIIHCEFNTTTSTLSNYSVCNITYKGQSFAFNTNNIWVNIKDETIVGGGGTFPNFNSSIAFDGTNYYACIGNQKYWKNGIIFKTTNFKDWTFCVIPKFTLTSNCVHEGAMGYYNGSLYLALRQDWQYKIDDPATVAYAGRSKMILARIRISDFKVMENLYIPDDAARPCFFKKDSFLYLAHSVWNRTYGNILQIGADNLINSKVISQIPDYMQYPSIALGNGGSLVAMTGTKNSIVNITVFTIAKYSNSTAEDTLTEILNNATSSSLLDVSAVLQNKITLVKNRKVISAYIYGSYTATAADTFEVVATLPVGYRPVADFRRVFLATNGNAVIVFVKSSTGEISMSSVGNATSKNLYDTLVFITA